MEGGGRVLEQGEKNWIFWMLPCFHIRITLIQIFFLSHFFNKNTLHHYKKISINFIESKPWNTLWDNLLFTVSTRELLTKVCVPPGYHSIIIQFVICVVSEIQYFDSSCPIIRSWCPHDDQFLQQEKQKCVGKRVGGKNNNQNFKH